MLKAYLSQPKIDSMIQKLACQIQVDKRNFLRVVGIANGGLPVSKPLAALLNLPHDHIRISHYDGKILRSTPIIEGRLAQSTGNLIVDDLIDEGWTFNTFAQHFGFAGNAMAVLFWNPDGPEPDFYVQKKPSAWVSFPWNADWKKSAVCK